MLQAALEAFDAEPTTHTWLDDFWESRYLGRRDRIALNANFFFLFTDSADPAEGDQAARAAGLVLGALDHKHRVDTETLPVATRKGAPMTMEQHKYLFSSTRIPGDGQDTARTPYTDAWPGPSRERHIVVFVRGHAFRMDVLGADGTAHTADEIADGLRAIRARVGDTRGPGVGHLTTKARADWAASRRALLAEGNEAALDDLETALFCVSLEDVDPIWPSRRRPRHRRPAAARRQREPVVRQGRDVRRLPRRHGGDQHRALPPRRDDRARAGRRHARRLHRGARRRPRGPVAGGPGATPLPFAITEERAEDIRAAGEDFAEFAASVATRLVVFDDLGSDRAKKLGVSPDSFVQMAYQLAHVRSKGFVGATYESIATLGFHHGRTEAMRVVTPEILAFAAAMDDRRPTTTPAARRSRRPRPPTSGAPRRARRGTRPSSTSGSSR